MARFNVEVHADGCCAWCRAGCCWSLSEEMHFCVVCWNTQFINKTTLLLNKLFIYRLNFVLRWMSVRCGRVGYVAPLQLHQELCANITAAPETTTKGIANILSSFVYFCYFAVEARPVPSRHVVDVSARYGLGCKFSTCLVSLFIMPQFNVRYCTGDLMFRGASTLLYTPKK